MLQSHSNPDINQWILTVENTYAHQSIGVERLPDSIRAIAIEIKDKQLVVDEFFELPLKSGAPNDEGVKPLYIDEKNPKFQYWLENDLVVSALSGEDVLVRPMDIKLTKQKEIDQVLYFQAEPLIPFPIDDTVVDRIIMGRDKEGTALTLLAVPGEKLQYHLDELSQVGIEPEVVTSEQAALSAYLQTIIPQDDSADLKAQILICLESDHTTCILNKKGRLAAAQTIPIGCQNLKSVASEENKQELKEAFEGLRNEITRVVYALGKQLRGEELSGIVITGEGANWGSLGKDLTSNLQKPLIVVRPLKGLTLEQQNLFATPLGAALTGLPHFKDQVNFRQNKYRFSNPLKRFKKALFVYGLVALGLAGAAYFSGLQYLGYQEDKVRENYVQMLARIKRPFNEVEGLYLKKDPTDPSLVKDVKQLPIYEITKRLDFLEKEIHSAPALFPLFPNVPRVSDVLAWLTSHPHVVLKEDGKENIESLVQIESLSYMMTKRPELNKKSERYQVKVELELTAMSPKEAREFHDALISPNDMVDPKAEVKWNATKGRYRTSFFLKDRTVYPSPGH